VIVNAPIFSPLPLRGGDMRAVVSKRGVDDGNQKVGAFSSPQKKAKGIIGEEYEKSKEKLINILDIRDKEKYSFFE